MPDTLAECGSDQEIFEWLGATLQQVFPAATLQGDLDVLVSHLQALPEGFRAMAATYDLDVSMALDDLGWHFANWHHQGLARETSDGLRVLEAAEAASLFDEALALVEPHWDHIGSLLAIDFSQFVEWYNDSDLEKALEP